MVFPPNAGMRMPMTDPSWFGTPVRPVEMHGPVGNPFWSPEARRALGLGEENRSVGPRRVQGGSTENGGAVERPFGMSQGRVGALNDMGGERIVPGSVGNENPQLVVGNPVQPPTDGQGVVMDPIELFRLRCMREAEQKFAQGLERMRQETNQIPEERSGSYVSLPNQGTPPGLNYQGNGDGPPPRVENGGDCPNENGNSGEGANEVLRAPELPKLGENVSPLGFGDWLVTIEPQMADLGSNSSAYPLSWNMCKKRMKLG